MTFVSKNRSQSASAISSNGFGSKIPMLFTRMSTSGTCRDQLGDACRRGQVGGHAHDLRASRSRPCPRSFSTAAADPLGLRPLTITEAPSRTSPAAAAKPIPAVEPVTRARFPVVVGPSDELLAWDVHGVTPTHRFIPRSLVASSFRNHAGACREPERDQESVIALFMTSSCVCPQQAAPARSSVHPGPAQMPDWSRSTRNEFRRNSLPAHWFTASSRRAGIPASRSLVHHSHQHAVRDS